MVGGAVPLVPYSVPIAAAVVLGNYRNRGLAGVTVAMSSRPLVASKPLRLLSAVRQAVPHPLARTAPAARPRVALSMLDLGIGALLIRCDRISYGLHFVYPRDFAVCLDRFPERRMATSITSELLSTSAVPL
jgi:hypothetical protein